MTWRVLLQEPVFGCVENRSSPISVIGIPLDHTGTFRPGTRFAPMRIREASCNIELYSISAGVFLDDIGFKDYRDLLLPPEGLEQVAKYIDLALKNILEEHRGLLISLGGEHLLTYFAIKPLLSKIDTLVVFDAHLDTRDEYIGSRLNHATFLRRLIEETPDLNVIHIGSRAYSKEELEFAARKNIKLYNALRALRGDINIGELGRVYVSIDMDVFDPAYAPGVSNPEPLGIDPATFMNILKQIYDKSTGMSGVDIVEVNPLIDTSSITSTLAAKIAIELSGLYAGSLK
ncbi:MAG: agmatinase [Desulfurococcaceae archaeon]|nr:agmatinase [Desulfurococcaceae archaeon]MCC6052858.1 agmatinase [Desulfurococcaceae archaeon]